MKVGPPFKALATFPAISAGILAGCLLASMVVFLVAVLEVVLVAHSIQTVQIISTEFSSMISDRNKNGTKSIRMQQQPSLHCVGKISPEAAV